MPRFLLRLVVLCAACLGGPGAWAVELTAAVRQAGVESRPVPGWVKRQAIDLERMAPPETLSEGSEWLLFDRQVNQAEGKALDFRQLVVRAVNQGGLDRVSQLEFGFDPAYQTLVLHHFRVFRDGAWQSRDDRLDLRVLQREKDLESRILNGALSLSVVIRDLRVGDVLDYAYSVEGVNPVFGGRPWGELSLRWSEPVAKMSVRLLLPDRPDVAVSARNFDAVVSERSLGGVREWSLVQHELPALLMDSNAPGWWDGWPVLEWSAYPDWRSVSEWAQPLFDTRASQVGDVAELALALSAEHPDPAQRFLAALRFVQGEIRYLGLEMGEGSHAPSTPETVLDRRFGDCKDKTRLLLAMLRRMGIEAQAALVNSSGLRGERQGLPGPGWFDHVIVRAEIDGKVYWVDPTRRAQQATLDALFQPDFGQALVIAPGVDALETMPAVRPSTTRIELDIDSSAGFDEPASITVRTAYAEGAAESARESFASDSRDAVQKRYLDYYASYFPGIEVAAPMDVLDSPEANRLEVVEHYRLKAFWVEDEGGQRRTASISEPDILSVLEVPQHSLRQAPLWQAHPRDFEATTVIRLPEDWNVEAEEDRVEDPHFQFRRTVEVNPERTVVRLVGSLKSLAHEVPADQVATYAENLRKARELVGFEFYYNAGAAAQPFSFERDFNGLVALIAFLLFAAAVVAAVFAWRFDPPAARVSKRVPALVGLGGWLSLPTLGLLLGPVIYLALGWTYAESFRLGTWTALTSPDGDAYHPMWAPLLLLELTQVLWLAVMSTLLLVLFLKRRTSAPVIYLWMLGFDAAMQLLIGVLTLALGPDELREDGTVLPQLIGTLVSSGIWAAYFLTSVRVRQTFVMRRDGRDESAADPAPRSDEESPPAADAVPAV